MLSIRDDCIGNHRLKHMHLCLFRTVKLHSVDYILEGKSEVCLGQSMNVYLIHGWYNLLHQSKIIVLKKNSESSLGDEEIFVLVCENARCIIVDSHFQTSFCLSKCMSLILKLFQWYNYFPVAYRAAQRAKESL